MRSWLVVICIALAVQLIGVASVFAIRDMAAISNQSSTAAYELPSDWLQRIVKPRIENICGASVHLAPMGIASYGVMEVGGRYFTYTLTTDAVKGIVYIPPNISVFGYLEWWDGARYYGQTFSVQLNAFVVARLADGATQYYWTQNVVVFDKRYEGLKVKNNVWNNTDETLTLNSSVIKGNGDVIVLGIYVYEAPDTIPFGRVELETWVRVDDGIIIIEFYANGQKYDEVIITPYVPAVSANITVAPVMIPVGLPLDLELVLGGPNSLVPWAILRDGQIGLELYVRANDSWIPPPSAWSIGYVTYERSHARVVPRGIGSVVVEPGAPSPRQLWAATAMSDPNIDVSADDYNVESIEAYVGICPTWPLPSWRFLDYFIVVTMALSAILYAILSVIVRLRL